MDRTHFSLALAFAAVSAVVLATPPVRAETTAAEELENLKQEIEVLKVRVEKQEQEAKLAKGAVSADPETAAALASAEVGKAIAEAEKSKAENDVAADFALYKALAGIDLSKAGVAGTYLSKNDLPASLRSKVLAEEQFSKAVGRLCTGDEYKKAIGTTSASGGSVFLVDGGLASLERAAANKVLRERVAKTTSDLDEAVEKALDVKFVQPSGIGTAAAALQGLNLLSQATRLFRVDTTAQVDSVALDANRTILPIVALHCGVEVIRPDVLYLRGELSSVDAQLNALSKLRFSIERARLASAQIEAEIVELKKKPDQESVEKLRLKNVAALNLSAVTQQANALVVDLGSVSARDLAISAYLEGKLNSKTSLRMVSVDAEAEARRVVRQNAWSSAKPYAVGAAVVRVTVRDEHGRTLYSSAAYDESGRVPIEKEDATSQVLGPLVLPLSGPPSPKPSEPAAPTTSPE